MLKKVAIAAIVLVVLLVVGLLGVAYILPGTYEARATVEMSSRPATAYALVSDLNTWPEWTAWNRERDPDAEWTFGGTPGTVGHTMSWRGPVLGAGRLEIVEVVPPTRVSYHLWFEGMGDEPGKGTITLEAGKNGTIATWTDTGSLGANPLFRLMGPYISSVLSGELSTGLAGLQMEVGRRTFEAPPVEEDGEEPEDDEEIEEEEAGNGGDAGDEEELEEEDAE